MVPSCEADSSTFPDRIFFTVPEAKKKRWLEIVGQHCDSIDPKERLFCCENHFSVRGLDFVYLVACRSIMQML